MIKQLEQKATALNLDENYKRFLSEMRERLKSAQIRVAMSINSEQIIFYWKLGSEIIQYQKEYKWGEHFLEQLSHDMRQAFPGMEGFSVRNLQRMRQFARNYPNFPIATQAVSQLPWGHIIRLIQMVKEEEIREWYARQGVIDKKTSNFHEHLPKSRGKLGGLARR